MSPLVCHHLTRVRLHLNCAWSVLGDPARRPEVDLVATQVDLPPRAEVPGNGRHLRSCPRCHRATNTPARVIVGRTPAIAPWQRASLLLAYCNMRTLYLRNVPDDVVARLERLAARDATSVGAVAVRELAEVSRRADNPALLGSLPDVGVDVATILRDLDAGRADR